MKRLVLTLAVLATFALGGAAQNVWKPLNCNTYFLGADSDGNLFAMAGYGGLIRSQDEGETWAQVLDYYMRDFMTTSPEGRIFVFPADYAFVCYSDDHGDTWQQSASNSASNYNMFGAYAVNNDTLLLWGERQLFYTLDAGATWNTADMSFIGDEYHAIGDVIANEEGDVYVSKWYYSGEDSGIFHSTLADMHNWELAAFDGAVVLHMEFDPEGNVMAGSYWGGIAGFQHEPGFYLLNGNQFVVADNGIVYSLHNVSEDYHLYVVLSYSGDHGETFYDYGEALSIQQNAPGGEGDGYLWKGRDGHLYFKGHGVYKKSVFNTNDIHYFEGEVVVSDTAPFGNIYYNEWLAIRTAENHDYCVTVDGFRPHPIELDKLIVHYDTIPVGTVIGAFGTIRQMTDGVGVTIDVIDVQQTTAHYYDAITSFLDPDADKAQIRHLRAPYNSFILTIDGEQQTWPLVFNGVTYDDTQIYTFIGHCGIQTDSYGNHFMGMELQDVEPFMDYSIEIDEGYLSINEWQPHLALPYENQYYLTVVGPDDFVIPYYPTHNGHLYKDTYLNNDIFREGTPVNLKGIEHIRYDIYGYELETVELVEMSTEEETTLTGRVESVPMPNDNYVIIPGLITGFVANGKTYYIDNPMDPFGFEDYFIVGNDTIYVGQEITATFTSRMLVDYGLNFYYRIHINEAEVLGIDEDGPSTPSTGSGLTVYPNPTNGVLFVETHGRASLSNQTYRITNLMGQILLTGQITAETQQIDVSGLPTGMYFVTVDGETRKFVVNK